MLTLNMVKVRKYTCEIKDPAKAPHKGVYQIAGRQEWSYDDSYRKHSDWTYLVTIDGSSGNVKATFELTFHMAQSIFQRG
jgi:hypothetical protein